MVEKSEMPALLRELIKQRHKWNALLLDLPFLAATLFVCAILAGHRARNALFLLRDAPDPFPVLLVYTGHCHQIASRAGEAGATSFDALDEWLQGIVLLGRGRGSHIRVRGRIAGKGSLIIANPPLS